MIALKLSPTDSVAVALDDITPGDTVSVDGQQLPATTAVPAGHKIALYPIAAGDDVIKYGWPIGHATADVAAGAWVHSHNLTTNLGANLDYIYQPTTPTQTTPPSSPLTFAGYHRANGDVGVRNDLFIVPTVGCINGTVDAIARQFEAQGIGPFTSVVVARHPHGCSQLGGDLANTRLILQDVIRHPNAGGALVVGLGCENNQLDQLREGLGEYDEQRVKFMITQDVEDEYAAAAALLQELRDAAQNDTRTETPLSQLRIGLKCGGSDGFSGITANRLLGHFSDYLIAQGGSAVLTEVPEMFGAEHLLMGRARSQVVFDDIVDMINGFKDYFRRYNQPIYENPSPGNKQGGITTLEEKSLGCTQKSGTSPVVDVLGYGERLRRPGLTVLQAPGNDMISSCALASAGCQIVLFTTGRGTPFGTYVPTIKVSSNTDLATRKPTWIDFDAGVLLHQPLQDVLSRFIDLVIDVASGRPTRNETGGMREIAILKDGVTE